ncbi:phage tail assembly chaperone [Asticcacaulis sp. EMRT-3]|uniref:phage tail assembly chaperone n=1 Tax=Asticcacaulis sp. EMRT-3 TaxID=3040349 RepID=UPI0024AF0592|nr:phage tail assembly chaperone [Asticcacaulis sp. EMRT-3]MDI7775380.1 phage tail assembly chaperone [Asticcacaulis sp. EMRT-3]
MSSPWAVMLRRALHIGLTPEVFWRLSWREWVMLNSAPQTMARPLDRADFDEMQRQFPDEGQ